MNGALATSATEGEARERANDNPQMPFVSIVIPVRNDARRLAVCLDSLANQDYPRDRYEMIVVDNGSHDDSTSVARSRDATVLTHPDLRVGALRNRGVAAARGDVLAFVDSDHELPREWLRVGVESLTAESQRVMVGAPCLAPRNGTWVQRVWELHRTRGPRRRATEWLGAGNMFLEKRDFREIGGFDEDLVAAEDVDLSVRFGKLGGQIISDRRLANYHHGEPRRLLDFARKEYWRGSSGVRAFVRHGMPLHELPSLVFPFYHLIGIAVVVFALVLVATGFQNAWPWPISALALLVLPSVLLGLKTAWQTSRPDAAPALAVLYFVYGLARAAALFKR
jgi:glycosyltransferase involved in cell wall biosynthesis